MSKTKDKPAATNSKILQVKVTAGRTEAQAVAAAAASPSINAAIVMDAYQGNLAGEVNLMALIESLQEATDKTKAGDLSNLEAMLIGQATALQTMFTSLAKRASHQEYLTQYGVYMTLALKAQAQSRATISALVDLKYPKQAATFVKQANMTTGPQQVNNGAFPDKIAQAHASAGDFETAPNKVLEESKDEVATCRDRYEYAGQNRTLVQRTSIGQSWAAK
jgi:hypothetical protein